MRLAYSSYMGLDCQTFIALEGLRSASAQGGKLVIRYDDGQELTIWTVNGTESKRLASLVRAEVRGDTVR